MSLWNQVSTNQTYPRFWRATYIWGTKACTRKSIKYWIRRKQRQNNDLPSTIDSVRCIPPALVRWGCSIWNTVRSPSSPTSAFQSCPVSEVFTLVDTTFCHQPASIPLANDPNPNRAKREKCKRASILSNKKRIAFNPAYTCACTVTLSR